MKKIYLFLLFLMLAPAVALAVDCPLGKVNDPAPGRCGLYRDADKDGYCDLSQEQESQIFTSRTADGVAKENVATEKKEQEGHRMGLITIILVAAYVAGLIAVNKKKISLVSHRKFWNWLLLALFVPTAFTSILLALAIEYGIVLNTGIDLGYWHFVMGWAFLLVSAFHFLWHLSYYFAKKA